MKPEEQEQEIERLRKMLWAIIWDNRGFTEDDIAWAGQLELDLAVKHLAELEALNAEQSEQISKLGKRIADLKLQHLMGVCDVCYTNSWQPCTKDDEGAVLSTRGWTNCSCCIATSSAIRYKAENVKLREACEALVKAAEELIEEVDRGGTSWARVEAAVRGLREALDPTLGKGGGG